MIDVPQTLKGRDFTAVRDWSPDEFRTLLDLAGELKRALRAGEPHELLPGRSLGLIFQKASTRTRVSFEVGMAQLGGTAIQLSVADMHLARGETLRDTAQVLSRYLDALLIRTYAQADVEELARHASIPVINGLTDMSHPCQAIADLLTIRERVGRLSGVRVTYLGDGNNVCSSLMIGAAKFGMRFTAATPPAYRPDADRVKLAMRVAVQNGGTVELSEDPRTAVKGADVLYTDVWTSMGQEAERERRLHDLRGYGIDDELLALSGPDTLVLHCMPAHYGEEITEEIAYGPQSGLLDQAENRLHTQKALLALIVR